MILQSGPITLFFHRVSQTIDKRFWARIINSDR